MPELISLFLKKNFSSLKKIILLVEEHSKNSYYWDNVITLLKVLKESGTYKIVPCVPGKKITQKTKFKSFTGRTLEVDLLKEQVLDADLVLSNNDFSVPYDLGKTPVLMPPVMSGWRYRKKHVFFKEYNDLALEFSNLIGIDSQLLSIKTSRFLDFSLEDLNTLSRLKKAVQKSLESLEGQYQKWGIKPFLFLKNNSGTYGLGMTTITYAEEIDSWTYKIRKKMKASKGGAKVKELIIQEGIATYVRDNGVVAEPVIYMIGSKPAGGFLRTHSKKGEKDNLNSPGVVYRTLCLSDLAIEVEGKASENVYGWLSMLGVLAVAKEFQKI